MKMRTLENRTIFHKDGTISYYSKRRDRYLRHEASVDAEDMKQFDEKTAVKIIDRFSEKSRKKGELRKSVACRMFETVFFHEVRYRLGREPRKGELGYLLPNGGGMFLKADILRQSTGRYIHVFLGEELAFVFYDDHTISMIKKRVKDWVEDRIH